MNRKNYAVMMALPGNEFSTSVVEGAAEAAKEVNANLLVFPNGILDANSPEFNMLYRYQYSTLSSFLGCKSIDGAVVEYGTINLMLNADAKRSYLSQIKGVPTVLLAEKAEGFPGVCFDNKIGIRKLVQHLVLDHGYTKIGFLSGAKDNTDAVARLEAFREECDNLGLAIGDDWIEYGNFTSEVSAQMAHLLGRHPDIQVLMCANDDMAIAACQFLRDMGKKPGEDIYITGFDDRVKSRLMRPSLTTIKADAAKLSYKALKAIDNNEDLFAIEDVPTEVMLRRSCGCQSRESDVEVEERFRIDALSKLEELEKDKAFMGEVEFVMKETLLHMDEAAGWSQAILKAFGRMGSHRSFLLFYDKPVEHKISDSWKMPEKLNLCASMIEDRFNYYEPGEKVYMTDELFRADFMDSTKAMTMLVLPVFFLEKQMGLIITECPIQFVQFAFPMGSMISNMIEMIHTQQENKRIQAELVSANQAKSQFLASMSHEIRTPINAVIGMNEMIKRESTQEEIRGYSADIGSAASNLLGIINDILDFSKIESGKMTIIPVPYHLGNTVKSLFKQLSFKVIEKDISFELNMNEDLPAILKGDDLRIKQVITNLLSNAVKYTDSGKIILEVNGKLVENGLILHVAVKDTGIGIREEDMKKLFEKFERVDETRNRSIEGTGLGLSIVSGFLHLMGSELRVKSEYGKGSEFYFDLFQEIEDATPLRSYVSKEKRHGSEGRIKYIAPGARVLLVDDNPMNRKVIKNLMKNTQVVFDEATNGKECVEKYANDKYDVVLLDHLMPIMDGIEAINRIKELPNYEKGKPPIVALTANAISGIEQKYKDAGFDTYLAKPVLPAVLDEMMVNMLPNVEFLKED
ncbi:MAG: substrate-binding domain-containing protein [Lachnospiraceae bacterium]|nr:substrate-binding domain-containing protein [Candidatus Merdinaster equi]